MVLLLTLRVLACRLHAKLFADFLVSILAGILMLIAYSMSVALPLIALAILWQLQRRTGEDMAAGMNLAVDLTSAIV